MVWKIIGSARLLVVEQYPWCYLAFVAFYIIFTQKEEVLIICFPSNISHELFTTHWKSDLNTRVHVIIDFVTKGSWKLLILETLEASSHPKYDMSFWACVVFLFVHVWSFYQENIESFWSSINKVFNTTLIHHWSEKDNNIKLFLKVDRAHEN